MPECRTRSSGPVVEVPTHSVSAVVHGQPAPHVEPFSAGVAAPRAVRADPREPGRAPA